MKYTAKEKLEPVGHDAVMQYKEKVKKFLQDPFLIYRVDCERRGLFKTSKEQLQLAIEMDREGEGHLKVEPTANTIARLVISQFPSLSTTQI